jgi:hypothetical protein
MVRPAAAGRPWFLICLRRSSGRAPPQLAPESQVRKIPCFTGGIRARPDGLSAGFVRGVVSEVIGVISGPKVAALLRLVPEPLGFL